MLHRLLRRLELPPYSEVSIFTGKGNWAVDQYYKWPHRWFYRHKLKMIVNELLPLDTPRILDFGAGYGVFTKELTRHGQVKSVDQGDVLDWRWKFEAIVCASSLEFCHLDYTLKTLRRMCHPRGVIIIASPMKSFWSGLYFMLIKDDKKRHDQTAIIEAVKKHFKIKSYKTWLGLYFCLVATP